MPSSRSSLSSSLVLGLLAACTQHPDDDASGGMECDDERMQCVDHSIPAVRKIDVLFVIDDAASSIHAQAALTADIEAFLAALGASEDVDYRIAITTSDVGHPTCDATRAPASGAFVHTACSARPERFASAEDYAKACEARCPAALADLATVPSAAEDGTVAPRPWIERTAGRTNLPDGVSIAQALQCFAPVGNDGCDFQSPLEAMSLAFIRSTTAGEGEFGFSRPDAHLAVVFVTDKPECSLQDAGVAVFDGTGDRTLWGDADAPTQAACWRAGTVCEGAVCEAADVAPDGTRTSPDAAVLQPLRRYTTMLETLVQRSANASPEVFVWVVGGVAQAGPEPGGGGETTAFEEEFGTAPGCVGETVAAVPPLRLQSLAEYFRHDEAPVAHSVCASTWSPALDAMGRALADAIEPFCYPGCPADADPAVPGLQPACVVSERVPGGARVDVPPCEFVGELGPQLPAGVDACAWFDASETRGALCRAQQSAEVKILRREGAPRNAHAILHVECEAHDELGCAG